VPIHDQSYKRYAGQRMPLGRAWLVITRAGLRLFFQKRAFVALLLVAWLPFVVRAVQFYASANFPQLSFIGPTPDTFRQFLSQQDPFVFFVTVYVGAGLIANDRRANALQVYLSKPLTRADYVFGKLGILMTFVLMVTLAPALLLLVVQAAFAGSFAFIGGNPHLFPAITVFSFVEATLASTAMFALSSLSNNSRFVGILYAGLIFFSDALYGVLRVVTRGTGVSWVSVTNNLAQLGDAIFRVRLRYETPWLVSLSVVILFVALSAIVLERRVRGVEVVA
jgi:ABC-2 type transport system permease protein